MSQTRIAIIGAGWAGISCLKVLIQHGYQVDVYEKYDDIGGTWHPNNNYIGLRIHAPAVTICYQDFPFPENIDLYERITSQQVFKYLKDYCVHFDLLKHMNFNIQIKSIHYDSKRKKSKLTAVNTSNTPIVVEEYDYVIHTHGFTEREIPTFKGEELFKGKIYHSFDVNEELFKKLIMSNQKVSVLGGSKTATDFMLKFYEYGYKVNWICRKPYLFLNYGKPSQRKSVFILALVMMRYIPKVAFWLLQKFKIIVTFGKPHLYYKKFHLGILDEHQAAILRALYIKYGIQSEIDFLKEDSITLKNGQSIQSDVLICCTGSGAKGAFFDIYVDEKKIDISTIKSVYHSRVIPEINNLIFTSFLPFSGGIVNAISQGNWVVHYLKLNPSKEYLINNAIQYNYNFFSQTQLFDSDHCHVTSVIKSFDSFINTKELTRWQVLKYTATGFFGPVQPLEFKPPKNIYEK